MRAAKVSMRDLRMTIIRLWASLMRTIALSVMRVVRFPKLRIPHSSSSLSLITSRRRRKRSRRTRARSAMSRSRSRSSRMISRVRTRLRLRRWSATSMSPTNILISRICWEITAQ